MAQSLSELLAAKGKTSDVIAKSLGLSKVTIDWYRRGARHRMPEVVARAIAKALRVKACDVLSAFAESRARLSRRRKAGADARFDRAWKV